MQLTEILSAAAETATDYWLRVGQYRVAPGTLQYWLDNAVGHARYVAAADRVDDFVDGAHRCAHVLSGGRIRCLRAVPAAGAVCPHHRPTADGPWFDRHGPQDRD